MLVTPSGIVTDVREEQRLKALSPMLVTLSGIVTEVRDEQSQKAELPILVIDLGKYYFSANSKHRYR